MRDRLHERRGAVFRPAGSGLREQGAVHVRRNADGGFQFGDFTVLFYLPQGDRGADQVGAGAPADLGRGHAREAGDGGAGFLAVGRQVPEGPAARECGRDGSCKGVRRAGPVRARRGGEFRGGGHGAGPYQGCHIRIACIEGGAAIVQVEGGGKARKIQPEIVEPRRVLAEIVAVVWVGHGGFAVADEQRDSPPALGRGVGECAKERIAPRAIDGGFKHEAIVRPRHGHRPPVPGVSRMA